MNIGFEWASQIEDWYTSDTFKKTLASITGGYHTEHNTDDTHATIHATGSITEYDRSVAQGVWLPVGFAAVNFINWTPVAATTTIRYALVGKTMIVAWNITGATVGGGAPALQMVVASSLNVKTQTFGVFHFSDNGTPGIGLAQAATFGASGTLIQMNQTNTGTNWAASAANTDVRGQIAFEIT